MTGDPGYLGQPLSPSGSIMYQIPTAPTKAVSTDADRIALLEQQMRSLTSEVRRLAEELKNLPAPTIVHNHYPAPYEPARRRPDVRPRYEDIRRHGFWGTG